MFLNALVNKEIIVGKTVKGYCRGVGLSLKNNMVKYLLCSLRPTADVDFVVSASSVQSVGESIALSALRPVFPKGYAKVVLGRPAYLVDGVYLGKITDLAMEDFVATYLYTDQGGEYPVTSIMASQDAILLKREQPFPLGQRIPAPLLSTFTERRDGLITKPILRTAIGQGRLLRLTVALPPFGVEL